MKFTFFIIALILYTCHGLAQTNFEFEEIVLPATDSTMFNTTSLKGKTIYIDFWFTTCKPCLYEIEYYKALQNFFSADTGIAFVSICIENNDRQNAWRKIIADNQLQGIHLFYARNRPQKVNLLRKYNISFPTYLIVDKNMIVLSHDAPRPSEKLRIMWALFNAKNGKNLSQSDWSFRNNSIEFQEFRLQNKL